MTGGSLLIQFQESAQNLISAKVGGPSVGGEDGFVEGAVCVCQPLGALVVEVGEGALGELIGIDAGRVEPVVTQADKLSRGVSYSPNAGIVIFSGFGSGRPWERESLETRSRCVAESAFGLAQLRPHRA